MMAIVIVPAEKLHEQRTQHNSSSKGNKESLYVEELLCYFFKLVIVFRVDHTVFHHENNHADLQVCQGEIFPYALLEEFPDVVDKVSEHEQEIPDQRAG
jgi:hypothetical protein